MYHCQVVTPRPGDGVIHFRDDIYNLDGTGFITGQPIGTPEESAG